MAARPVLALLLVALPDCAVADWSVADADPVALARVEVPRATGADQPDFLEIACLRGTGEGNYTLRAGLRMSRSLAGLPPLARQELRLGRDCPGPIEAQAGLSVSGPVTFRVAGETVATRAAVGAAFLRTDGPPDIRREGACEIAVHGIDPDEARLVVEGQGETATRYLVELLLAEHQGDVTLEVPDKGARQAFPIAGAAGALGRIGALCGW